MPVYSYRALNSKGRTVRGVIDADSPQRARQKIRADGLHPVEVNPASGFHLSAQPLSRLRKALKASHNRSGPLADTTRQAATLIAAGLPLVTTLATIQEQIEDEEFRRMLALIREDVTGGETLANALKKHPDVFSPEYIHLVQAGELAGALDQVMEKLAEDLERSQARRARINSALAYPVFMTFIGFGVLFFLLSFIIPTLTGLFDNLGAALPWPTRMLLWLSGLLSNYWWAVILGLIAAAILIGKFFKKDVNYRRLEAVIFKIPRVGPLVKKLLLARVMRGLAIMGTGGVALTNSLVITSQSLGRSAFALALKNAADMVGQGRSLADGLSASNLFPPLPRRMIAVGEASGTLNTMMARVAQTYEEETDRALSTLTSLIEPIIILVMGLLVGFVVMAVLLPIFDLSGLVA